MIFEIEKCKKKTIILVGTHGLLLIVIEMSNYKLAAPTQGCRIYCLRNNE